MRQKQQEDSCCPHHVRVVLRWLFPSRSDWGGGGLNSVHCVTGSHAFIEALFFHRVCSFPSHVYPYPPVCVCSLVSVVTLFLPAASLTASTSIRHSHFFLQFPMTTSPERGGRYCKSVSWYKSGYVSDWQQNVLIPGLWRGVITSPLRVYITRHCYFTGYILPPPWEPDVEKVNGQLVLMQDYFLPAGVCAWEQQLKVGCRCSRVSLLLALVFQSLCYIPWPLTHASESSLPQGQTNYSC